MLDNLDADVYIGRVLSYVHIYFRGLEVRFRYFAMRTYAPFETGMASRPETCSVKLRWLAKAWCNKVKVAKVPGSIPPQRTEIRPEVSKALEKPCCCT